MLTAELIARVNDGKIAGMKPDLVFGVAASHMIARLNIEAPMIHFSDATFRAVLGYYEEFSGLAPRTIRQGDQMERAALHRSDAVMLSSDWAATSAVVDYDLAPERITVAPLGANVDSWPKFDRAPRGDVCRLLFVGVDWQRKGGDVAHEVLRSLLARGHKAELHIVGCDPPIEANAPGVHRHGFLKKTDEAEYEHLKELYSAASFLLLPSRAEAYGLVFAEASAFGLPILARRTGGVPSVVEDGVNGILFDPCAGVREYVQRIEDIWGDKDAYLRLRLTSRDKFERDLNWTAWGERAEALIDSLVARHHRQLLPRKDAAAPLPTT
jgi:glycosyltransferase involved in cell wall biosynthesis